MWRTPASTPSSDKVYGQFFAWKPQVLLHSDSSDRYYTIIALSAYCYWRYTYRT